MARGCFFVEGIEPGAQFVDLSPEVSHHLDHVLRLRAGQTVEIRDGRGNAWTGQIAGIHRGRVAVRLIERLDLSIFEPPLAITLALAFARSDIMDLVVRQATEMGVSKLAAFRAARSQYSLVGPRGEKKVLRWLKIAREAVCQCGRTRAPEIAVFEDLKGFLGSLPPDGGCKSLDEGGGATGTPSVAEAGVLRLVALEGERERSLDALKKVRPGCTGVLALIGPEGGWEDFETQRLLGVGFHPIHLGPRILRFETAAVALISSIQLLWGDFGEAEQKGSEENEMH